VRIVASGEVDAAILNAIGSFLKQLKKRRFL
jgi:hypothetical protein